MDRKWWVLIAVGTGSLMAALDGSVVNTILPVLRDNFHSSVASIQWVTTIYLIVLSGFLLTFGRLGDLYGHKKIYLWGFLVFIISSALCGVAWSIPTLIIFRATQAVGGAMLASNAPAIVTSNFPAEQRGRAIGLTSTMTYLGLTIGPSLGGWLTQLYGWRMVFYINMPIGAIASIIGLLFISTNITLDKEQRFDILGALLFLGGLSSLLLGLNKGAELGWSSPTIIGLITGAFILFITFIFIESRSVSPMLDLSLFRVPLFTMSGISALMNYICIYSVMFLLPFYLIQGREFKPAQAGLLLTVQPIIMAIVAPISGVISDTHGSRKPGMIGMAFLSLGLFMLGKLEPDTAIPFIICALILTGFGTGVFISPNTSALLGSAPKSRQGIASGIQAAARNVGMVLGIGIVGAIFTTNISQGITNSFYKGIDSAFFVVAGIAAVGIIMSAAKEK